MCARFSVSFPSPYGHGRGLGYTFLCACLLALVELVDIKLATIRASDAVLHPTHPSSLPVPSTNIHRRFPNKKMKRSSPIESPKEAGDLLVLSFFFAGTLARCCAQLSSTVLAMISIFGEKKTS